MSVCSGSIMEKSEGYGRRLGERLRAEQASTIVTSVLRTADMAVTETRCDDPVVGLSGSLQREDAFLVSLTSAISLPGDDCPGVSGARSQL
jgi:hypothetical protein